MEKDKKIKILIVDDNDAIRQMYAEIFREEDFEVEEAFDGLDGLEKITKKTPDIIFTGIIMPRMDGFSLKETLDKNVATANIPVIMSSHMGRREDEEKAKKMGIRGFFVQGMISPREVMERVKLMFEENVFRIKFSPDELDAPKLSEKLKIYEKFKCRNCGKEMGLELKATDWNKKEFLTRLVCFNCEK